MERFWDKWQSRTRPDQNGQKETDQDNDSQDDADVSPDAKNAAKMDGAPSFDSQSGDGASPVIGTDLVFRAYAPAKVYWVVQMYDTYDGSKWTQSDMMKSGNCLADRIRAQYGTLFPQRIILEKNIGPLLPYAYRFEHGRFRDPAGSDPQPLLLNLHDNVKLGLRALEKPKTPLSYFVMSYVPSQKTGPDMERFLLLRWNYGPNYRALPQGVISERTYELARKITADATTPYEKACRTRPAEWRSGRFLPVRIKTRLLPAFCAGVRGSGPRGGPAFTARHGIFARQLQPAEQLLRSLRIPCPCMGPDFHFTIRLADI